DLYLASVTAGPSGIHHGALIWLGNETGGFTALDAATGPDLVFDAADIADDGKIALLGLTQDGKALRATARSTKHYHWQIVRPRAAQAFGDQRVNPFGVGGEMEIRSGLIV